MPLLLPRPFGGNPYPGSRGQKHSKAQQEASSPASSGARTTAGRGGMGFAGSISEPAAEPPSAGSARDTPGTWPSGVEPSSPPLPQNEVLSTEPQPGYQAKTGRFGYPSIDPWVATPTRVDNGGSSLDRPGAGPSALLTEPAAGPPISFDLNQNGALSGERKDAGGLLSRLLGLLGRGPKRDQGQKQQQQQQQGHGYGQKQPYHGVGAGKPPSGWLHDVERGRRTMVQLRDLLMADASLFQVREAGGEVVAVVEGDSLRVRVRGPSRSSSGSGGWGDAGAGSWGSGGGHAGPVGLGKGGAEDDAVVRLEVGDVFSVDLNPPGGQLLPLLHVAPGVYTFRAPNAQRPAAAAAAAAAGWTEAGGVAAAAWPLPRASGHTRHRSRKQQHGSSGSSSDEGEAGARGGDGYYYCLTVAPTICDSCSLEQLDEVLASYTQYSRSTVPAPASAAAGLVHDQAIMHQEHQHLAPAGPYDAPAATAAAAGAGPASGPPGTWQSAPAVGMAPYGTVYPEIKPYEYDKQQQQQQQPYGPGQGQPQAYEGAIVPAAEGGAAGAAAAGAAKTHQLVARLSIHAVLAARSVGETLIDGAYGGAYRIRRGADEVTRRLPPSRRNRQSAAALPMRLLVLVAWTLSRTAAAAVATVTEMLAGMGAWAAEATMFGGALLGRWLPLLARARRVRGTLGRRGGRPAPGGGSGGAGSKLSLMLATVMLLIPADVLKALMGAALLAYGELHGSVEEAARVVLLAVADAASDVAGHVGGPDAAGLTRGSLEAAGYALEAATGLRKVGLRAVAREFKRRHAAALVVVPPPPAPEPTASRHHRNRR